MPVRSMTGFARADGSAPGTQWTWEVRSVNGRGLDLRLRLPPGLDRIEVEAREHVAARLTRGNVQITLSTWGEAGGARLVVNEEVLDQLARAVELVRARFDVEPSTAEGILAIRGVLETAAAEPDEAEREALAKKLLASLETALDDLIAVREREGASLADILATRLAELERLVAAAEASPARTPDAIRARLAEQVAALIDAQSGLDPARLHQEAVLLATKADIREELDRLVAHIAAARELFAAGGPIGRRLDFLSQELNREVNTLCAKSNDVALTAVGLEMKAVVDQFREQIQNLE